MSDRLARFMRGEKQISFPYFIRGIHSTHKFKSNKRRSDIEFGKYTRFFPFDRFTVANDIFV